MTRSEALAISAGEAHSLAPSEIRLSIGARFYERLGFKKKLEDRLFILEQDGLNYFIAERDTP